MRVFLMIWAALVFSAQVVPAFADSFGPWGFGPPDGYEKLIAPGKVTYTGPKASFVFYNPAPSKGSTPKEIGPDLIEDVLGAPRNLQQFMLEEKIEDGRDFAMFLAGVDGEIRLAAVFVDGAQAGLVTVTPPQIDQLEEERQALLETEFHETKYSEAIKPSRLPDVAWPEPVTDLVATTRAKPTLREAAEQGIEAKKQPLPSRFLCYRDGTPRAVTATPDFEFTFDRNGSYRVSNGQRSGGGKWWTEADDTFDYVVKVDGTMAFDGYFVMWQSAFGQGFSTEDPYADDEVELTCHQEGPRAERVQQALARVAVDRMLMNCTDGEGKPFRFMFGDGAYRAPEGAGQMHIDLEGDGDDYWRALLRFHSGPYTLYDGEMTVDETGAASLRIKTEWHTGSMFYSSTETTILATCVGMTPPRPLPEYGQDPAPPAAYPAGGLPEGLFRSFEQHSYYSGGMYQYEWRDTLTYIAADGRSMRDINMDDLGGLPDCTKSRPDGYGYCGEYRVNGNTLSFRDEGDHDDDDWSEPEIFREKGDGFTIGEVEYTPLQPLDPTTLHGDWVASSYTGSGPGAVGWGVGTYSDADVYWKFTPEGRFDWHQSVTNTTLITPMPMYDGDGMSYLGASGGGSSTSSDGGSGSYQFDGTWLSLTFDDGRTRRLFVMESSGDDPNIILGGNSLKRG